MSIQGNRDAAKRMIEDGGLVRAEAPTAPNTPSVPTSSYPAAPNSLLRTPLPPLSVQQPDMQRQWQSPAVPQARVTPLPPAANANAGSQAASQTTIVLTQSGGGGLKVQTNAQTVNTPLGLVNFTDSSTIKWSADSQGDITATGSATSTLFISRMDFKRWALWATNVSGAGIGGGFTSINDNIISTLNGAGVFNFVAASATDDVGVEFSTQGLSGAYNAINGANSIVIPARDFSFFCPIRLTTLVTERVWVCMSNPNNSGDVSTIMNSDTPNRDIVGFRYNPAVGANWFAVMAKVNPGGGVTAVDTGVPATTNGVMLRVDYTAATTTAVYSINGVQVATISTNPPTINFGLGGFLGIETLANSVAAMRTSSFYIEARTIVTTS